MLLAADARGHCQWLLLAADMGGVSGPMQASPAPDLLRGGGQVRVAKYVGKVVAKYVGKEANTYRNTSIWVPKFLVTNMQGPKSNWGPKSSN